MTQGKCCVLHEFPFSFPVLFQKIWHALWADKMIKLYLAYSERVRESFSPPAFRWSWREGSSFQTQGTKNPFRSVTRYEWVNVLVFGCGASREIQNHQHFNCLFGTALPKHTQPVIITRTWELSLHGTTCRKWGHIQFLLRAAVTWRSGRCIPPHREHLREVSSLLHAVEWINRNNEGWGKEVVPFT